MLISSLSAIEDNNTSPHVQVLTGVSLVHLSEDFEDDNDLSLDTGISSSFKSYFNTASRLSSTNTSILVDDA